MPVPILYRISRIFVRLGVYRYFRRLEITGRQNIPSKGPIIFASNHPHSITDALLLGLGTGGMLHFIAHSGLFRSKYKAWFLRSSGVLQKGESIGIFPEGTSAEERPDCEAPEFLAQ